MQLWIKAFGLTLFELHITEGFETEATPQVMLADVSSIPVYMAPEEESTDDDDEEGRIKMGFQQKNGK